MPNEEEQKPVQASTKTCKKTSTILAPMAFIAALIAIALSFYTMHHNQDLRNALRENNEHLALEVKQLKLNQTETQALIEKGIQSTQTQLQTKLETLNQEVQTTLNQTNFKKDDWLLLKARYYIQLAQINAHWSTDFNSAIALLVQADEVLKNLNENKVFDIRQNLAKEIAQLHAISTLDIAGVLSQLDAAQASVDGLSMQSATNATTEEKATENATPVSGWRYHLQNSLNQLGKLVVIRRDNEEIKPLMSPLYEALLKENIRLNIQEAQWAVLNRNALVYEMVLKQAVANIKKTFNPSSQSTAALINQLNKLQEVHLTQEQPEIGAALPLINQLIESKELLNKPNKEQGDKQS